MLKDILLSLYFLSCFGTLSTQYTIFGGGGGSGIVCVIFSLFSTLSTLYIIFGFGGGYGTV